MASRLEMRGFWRAIGRTVFWSYERGSWPYDVMVAAILFFVLATPRHWFHDQSLMASPNSPAIAQVPWDSNTSVYTYHISAALLFRSRSTSASSTQLEKQIHDFLSRTVPELRSRTFQVELIHPVTASSGAIQSYDVKVRTVTMP